MVDIAQSGFHGRNEGQQIAEPVRGGAENENREFVTTEVLLAGNVLVYRKQNVKAGGFGSI